MPQLHPPIIPIAQMVPYMCSPLVSVIIPTFRRPELLPRAIASVFSQTYVNWELLIIDDNDASSAARGETEAVMRGHTSDRRIRYLKHEVNQGLPAARNTAIRAASGSLIAFLDDDDEWFPEKLEKQVQAFRNDPGTTLVYTGRHHVDSDGQLIKAVPADGKGLIRDRLLEENWIGTPSSVMCRRRALVEAGGFDADMPSLEDWDLYLRMKGRFALIAEPLTLYYLHDGGRMMDNFVNVAKALDRLYGKTCAELRFNPASHAAFLGHHGNVLYLAGERRRARKAMLRSLALRPFDRRTQRQFLLLSLGEAGMVGLRRVTAPLRTLLRRTRARPRARAG
jgi:glycosyltransferase involved in cell wall biosynthesis